jgi:hypothetical protein
VPLPPRPSPAPRASRGSARRKNAARVVPVPPPRRPTENY